MKPKITISLLLAVAMSPSASGTASAHCDTMDGPVISAARRALDTGNINLALVWVQPDDEETIQSAFDQARAKRTAGSAAREAAEHAFFEVLVRVHRAGEGAVYTGIKPAGTPIDPGVRAADRSLETRSVAEVEQLLTGSVQSGLQSRFRAAVGLKDYAPDDVAAGREYVKAYVTYTHFVEGIGQAASSSAHHHENSEQHAEHAPGDHAGAHGGHTPHTNHTAHLPWILVVVLGLGLVCETVFLLARKKGTAA